MLTECCVVSLFLVLEVLFIYVASRVFKSLSVNPTYVSVLFILLFHSLFDVEGVVAVVVLRLLFESGGLTLLILLVVLLSWLSFGCSFVCRLFDVSWFSLFFFVSLIITVAWYTTCCILHCPFTGHSLFFLLLHFG